MLVLGQCQRDDTSVIAFSSPPNCSGGRSVWRLWLTVCAVMDEILDTTALLGINYQLQQCTDFHRLHPALIFIVSVFISLIDTFFLALQAIKLSWNCSDWFDFPSQLGKYWANNPRSKEAVIVFPTNTCETFSGFSANVNQILQFVPAL